MRNAFHCAILPTLWISSPENSVCLPASLILRTLPYTRAWIPHFTMSRIVRGHYLPARG
jgi:hypothetical protein